MRAREAQRAPRSALGARRSLGARWERGWTRRGVGTPSRAPGSSRRRVSCPWPWPTVTTATAAAGAGSVHGEDGLGVERERNDPTTGEGVQHGSTLLTRSFTCCASPHAQNRHGSASVAALRNHLCTPKGEAKAAKQRRGEIRRRRYVLPVRHRDDEGHGSRPPRSPSVVCDLLTPRPGPPRRAAAPKGYSCTSPRTHLFGGGATPRAPRGREIASDPPRGTCGWIGHGGGRPCRAGGRSGRSVAPRSVSHRREVGRLEASVKRTPLAGVGRASFIFNVRYTDGGSGASEAPDTLSDPPHARAAGALRTAKRAPGGFPRRQRAIRCLFRRGTARWTRTDPVDRARAPEPARLPPAALPRTGQVIRWGVPFCRTAQRTHLAPEPGPQRRQGSSSVVQVGNRQFC